MKRAAAAAALMATLATGCDRDHAGLASRAGMPDMLSPAWGLPAPGARAAIAPVAPAATAAPAAPIAGIGPVPCTRKLLPSLIDAIRRVQRRRNPDGA